MFKKRCYLLIFEFSMESDKVSRYFTYMTDGLVIRIITKSFSGRKVIALINSMRRKNMEFNTIITLLDILTSSG